MKKYAVGVTNGNWRNRWNDSEPLGAELTADGDLVKLHNRLTALVGAVEATKFGLTLVGRDYSHKCRDYLSAIAAIAAERSDYDPRTPEQVEWDALAADTRRTLEDARPM